MYHVVPQVLSDMQQLRALVLRQAGLTDMSAPQLAAIMTRAPQLQHLDVSQNSLGPASMREIALALPEVRNLKTV